MDNNNRKVLNIDFSKPNKSEKKEQTKKVEQQKQPPKKRIITTTEKWIADVSPENHLDYIIQIRNNNITNTNICNMIQQQIHQKISGYRSQDILKNLFVENLFVDFAKVLDLMIESQNNCYYCKKCVHVLYENVREPKQWTLERIDNDFGHNKTNLVIACLECNLRRRTMHQDRYVFTKQMNIVKQNI
jgi:hypothetical protein